MASRRLARLNEQLKREIAVIIHRDVRDPRVGSPTVTDVAVTPDLFHARVYVRPDPTLGEEPGDFLSALAIATPFIRRELGKSLSLRRVPELQFEEDRTMDHARRIEKILRDVLPRGDEAGSVGQQEADGNDKGGSSG